MKKLAQEDRSAISKESGGSSLGKKRPDFSPRKKAGGRRWLADWFPFIIAGTL
jgi:hypothetical protein